MIWKPHGYKKSTCCQKIQNVKILLRAQDSCACTTLLCMHTTLVHAQHSCACTGPGNPGARPGTQKGSWAGPRPWTAAFLGPRPGPWPLAWSLGSLAQCMHKSLVRAQECCACTRILGLQRPAKACKGLQRPAKALQRPCKGLAKACKDLAKALQRPAKACKGMVL